MDIDIKLKGKTDPQVTINVVVYGVRGIVNDVPLNLWDRIYYLNDNKRLQFEVPIEFNYYYYFTNDLKHDNEKSLKFPTLVDKYPFFTKNTITNRFGIKLAGYYQFIYTDFYRGSGSFIVKHMAYAGSNVPPNIYSIGIDYSAGGNWVPLTLNAIIKIDLLNGDDAEISFSIAPKSSAIFDGAGYSTFYIKYLHP